MSDVWLLWNTSAASFVTEKATSEKLWQTDRRRKFRHIDTKSIAGHHNILTSIQKDNSSLYIHSGSISPANNPHRKINNYVQANRYQVWRRSCFYWTNEPFAADDCRHIRQRRPEDEWWSATTSKIVPFGDRCLFLNDYDCFWTAPPETIYWLSGEQPFV